MLTGDHPQSDFNRDSPSAAAQPDAACYATGHHAVPSGPDHHLDQSDELDQLAAALSEKFEELSLIHHLSDRLEVGQDTDQLCELLLAELTSCTGARTTAIELFPDTDAQIGTRTFYAGQPVDLPWLRHVADYTVAAAKKLHRAAEPKDLVAIVNAPCADGHAAVRSLVVPIDRNRKRLGRMIALRGLEDPEFGTVEANLLKSTSMMLAAHLINQRQFIEMQHMFEGMIQSLVSALDAKDAYTCGHSSRVADLAVELARRLGFGDSDIQRIRMAGILHDIGKIGVKDSVLCKPGKLTDEEFEQIKQHPVLGFEILQGIRAFRKILPAVRHHHESWDGSGYPDGLCGESIPRDAQVLAVADAFDAMMSDRPYRSGMPLEKVVAIFQKGRGTQWAADVVDALLEDPELMQSYADRKDA